MRSAPFVAFGMLVVLGLAWLGLRGDGEITLVPLPEAARPAPESQASDAPLALDRLGRRSDRTGAEARAFRNERVEAWREALIAHADEKAALRAAEGVEFDVWEARWRVGEIDAAAMHAAFVALLEREISRLKSMQARGQGTRDAVQRAVLFWQRERVAAGIADAAAVAKYDADRERYIADRRAHFSALIEAASINRDHARVEVALLVRELPPASALQEQPQP